MLKFIGGTAGIIFIIGLIRGDRDIQAAVLTSGGDRPAGASPPAFFMRGYLLLRGSCAEVAMMSSSRRPVSPWMVRQR